MKKWDVVFLSCIIIVAVIWLIMIRLNSETGNYAIVSVDGVETARYDLKEDIEVDIIGVHGGRNHLVIQNGVADVTDATCPDELCVNQKEISKTGETIVCLPNRVVVSIIGESSHETDAIAQ